MPTPPLVVMALAVTVPVAASVIAPPSDFVALRRDRVRRDVAAGLS
jgi:hypothetical protein